MALPKPPVPLTGGCSVIFDNVFYSYSDAGFESLALEQGTEWEKLPSGVSVKGGVCVGTRPPDPSAAALFIVGGTAASPDYTGLQKFTYSTGKWETVELRDLVTKNRVRHSAIYIPGSDSILVYAGSQDGYDGPSSQTFTIKASEPHDVLAFQSTISPPSIAPLLLPWSTTRVAMVGGGPTNLKVTLFEPATSWVDSGTTLAEPLWKGGATTEAALVVGDDNSKHLYTFDLSTAPNRVNRILLMDGNGAPVTASAPITPNRNKPSADVEERQLNADNWPQYNSTSAPMTTRSQYSLATDPNGMIVISGGDDQDVLSIFDGKENQWLNATEMLVPEQEVVSLQSVPTSSISTFSTIAPPTTSSTASSLPSPTESPVTAAATSGLPRTAILGIVLGAIFGLALLLIALLLCIKKARKRQTAAEAGAAGGSGGMSNEKVELPMDIPKGPPPSFRGHAHQDSAASFSSMAILMGKVQKPAGLQRSGSKDSRRSSASGMFNKEFKSTIGRPQYQEAPEPEFLPRAEKATYATADMPKPRVGLPVNQNGSIRRSSGWNRYWSGASLNILGLGSTGNTTQRQTMVSETSHYSDTHRMTQDSATVPPLHVEGRFELSRVNSGSPTVSEFHPRVREGMSGQIERPISSVSSSGYSSGIPASVHEAWDPTSVQQPWGAQRAPSSTYSESTTNFTALGAPAAARPPTGVSRLPQLETAALSSDMSWLNLGENKSSHQ
ncbi:hypothetical protein DL763_006019 [Monosporascus cannonballus]|nr:hypothetical protein DL763_006019 [Monosporascus cannonballus]